MKNKNPDFRHTAISALIELMNAFDVVEAEFAEEEIDPARLIKALDYYAWELKEAREMLEGFVE